MAADIVAIELGLTDGDLYTLWAPRWRDAGDEWEAFLGAGEELYAFESVADLVVFVRTGPGNDLTDHPSWDALTAGPVDDLEPGGTRRFDLIGVPDLLAGDPTADAVQSLNDTLAIASSLGQVCDLTPVNKFFNGNPVLSALGGGAESFTGRDGAKRWTSIGNAVERGWGAVVDAIDEVISVQQVDAAAAAEVQKELRDAADRRERAAQEQAALDDDAGDAAGADAAEPVTETEAAVERAAASDGVVLGSDVDFWEKVGIDPVQLMTSAGTFYTLRCYLGDQPVFLGRNGRISVFGSERSLARYLADEHDHDLSDLPTYDNIRTAATDGSLHVEVHDANVYVLTGLSDDLADGPEVIDRDQLDLAVELLHDVGDYSEDSTVADILAEDQPLGGVVASVLAGEGTAGAAPSEAVKDWEKLEAFVESRLRRE